MAAGVVQDGDERRSIGSASMPTDSIERAVRLGAAGGRLRTSFFPVDGGLLVLDRPTETLLAEVWPAPPLGAANGTLHHLRSGVGEGDGGRRGESRRSE